VLGKLLVRQDADFSWGGRVEPRPLLLRPFNGLLYQPRMMDECEETGGMLERANPSTRRKPVRVLCPPQVSRADPVSNSGRRGGKAATNRLSYDMT
jgi:hypothetical protein